MSITRIHRIIHFVFYVVLAGFCLWPVLNGDFEYPFATSSFGIPYFVLYFFPFLLFLFQAVAFDRYSSFLIIGLSVFSTMYLLDESLTEYYWRNVYPNAKGSIPEFTIRSIYIDLVPVFVVVAMMILLRPTKRNKNQSSRTVKSSFNIRHS